MDWFPIIWFSFCVSIHFLSSQLMVWRRQTMHFPWLGYIGMILRGSCGDFETDWHRTIPICSVHVQSWFHPFHPMAAWWFGTWNLFFHILGNIGNHIPKWLSYFSEGWLNRQPDGDLNPPGSEKLHGRRGSGASAVAAASRAWSCAAETGRRWRQIPWESEPGPEAKGQGAAGNGQGSRGQAMSEWLQYTCSGCSCLLNPKS